MSSQANNQNNKPNPNQIVIFAENAIDADDLNPVDPHEAVDLLLQVIPLRTHLAITASLLSKSARHLPNSVVGTLYSLGARAHKTDRLTDDQKQELLDDLRGQLRSPKNDQVLIDKLLAAR